MFLPNFDTTHLWCITKILSQSSTSTSNFSQTPPSNLKNVCNPYTSNIPSPTLSQEEFYSRLENLLSIHEDKKKTSTPPRSRSQSPLHQKAFSYADKAGLDQLLPKPWENPACVRYNLT